MARQAVAKTKEKKLGVRAIKSLNVGFYGEEPIYDRLMTVREVQDAQTWYAYNMDEKEGVQYLITYLTRIGRSDLAKLVKAGGDKFFSPTLFKYARLINNGAKLPEVSSKLFAEGLQKDVERYLSYKNENKKYVAPARLNEQSVGILAVIEEAIDNRNPKFSIAKFFKERSITEQFVVKVINHYAAELEAANKLDQDEDVTSYIMYVSKLISAMKAHAGIKEAPAGKKMTTVRKPRKPRAKKVVPPEKKVATLKFLVEDKDLGVKSIKPTDIIGKQQLWVYDTRFNKITVFRAKNEHGLDVKGTTILNWDENLSKCKRAGRSAKKIVDNVVSCGKVALRRIHDDIKSANITVSGRIGENMILLRVEK
jgi:hypothetical protein